MTPYSSTSNAIDRRFVCISRRRSTIFFPSGTTRAGRTRRLDGRGFGARRGSPGRAREARLRCRRGSPRMPRAASSATRGTVSAPRPPCWRLEEAGHVETRGHHFARLGLRRNGPASRRCATHSRRAAAAGGISAVEERGHADGPRLTARVLVGIVGARAHACGAAMVSGRSRRTA